MNITEELRKWARQFRSVWIDPHSGDLTYITNEHACPPNLDAMRLEDYITAIADRIDTEHEREVTEATLATTERGWVRLPVDADGEPIHVGDLVQFRHDAPTLVTLMRIIKKRGDEPSWDFFGENGGCYGSGTFNELRHYHAPTVEDVLRQVIACANNGTHVHGALDTEQIVAEYAAKLQLREDA